MDESGDEHTSRESNFLVLKRWCCLQVIKTVRFCNAFNLPIVSLLLRHDTAKAAPENGTRISELANLIFAYSEAAVPKLAVVCGPEAVPAAKVYHI